MIDIRAIQNQERLDARAGAGLPAQVAHAAQVALALLADVGDEDQVAELVGEIGEGLDHARDGQQRGQPSAVVGDARAMQPAIGGDINLFVLARREHGIQMRGEGDVGAGAIFDRMGDDVAAAIDPRHATERAKLRQHPLGALLFEERGGGDAAKLQVLLVDPLLLPDEPLQGVAEGRGIGQIRGHFGERRIRRIGQRI